MVLGIYSPNISISSYKFIRVLYMLGTEDYLIKSFRKLEAENFMQI